MSTLGSIVVDVHEFGPKPDRAMRAIGQARNTTVQVWTVGEGSGIGSDFRQTCCATDNFRDHGSFFVGSSAPVPPGTRTILTRRITRCGLTSDDSGLQLDLEIALNGVPAPNAFGVETSDDVIEDNFTSTPDSHIWDLSPMRLGAAKTSEQPLLRRQFGVAARQARVPGFECRSCFFDPAN
jgi:hypothetical protein